MAAFASSPWQSGMNVTGRPRTDDNADTVWASDMSGFTRPLGRPKCARINTLAPRSESSLTVGTAARKRVSSVTKRSEEHTSELQSLMRISYAVFCLKKKKKETTLTTPVTIRQQHNSTITKK